MPAVVASMAGSHSQAFLPSGAFDYPSYTQPQRNSYQPDHRSSSSSRQGFPPSTSARGRTALPSTVSFQNLNAVRSNGYHAPASGFLPVSSSLPAVNNGFPRRSTSRSRAGASPLSVPAPPNLDPPSSHHPSFGLSRSPTGLSVLREDAWSPTHPESSYESTEHRRKLEEYASATLPTSLSRSVSADAAAPARTPSLTHSSTIASTHTSAIVQRLAQQNAVIREAWEAERSYLEANRRRAEEVYQEERSIMEHGHEQEKDAMLQEFDDERVTLFEQMTAMQDRMRQLESENSTLRAVAAQAGVASPFASSQSQLDPSGPVTHNNDRFSPNGPSGSVQRGSLPQSSSAINAANASILPPGLQSVARRPQFPGSGNVTRSRTSPTFLPEAASLQRLEPRHEPQHSAPRDPLPHEDNEDDSKTIDVQEVDSKLEGIPIKARSVSKPTFRVDAPSTSDHSKASSPSGSPPPGADAAKNNPSIASALAGTGKDQTLSVLAAEASKRLTMHAGHTPNHSISLFPSMSAQTADTSTNVTGPSEGATPRVEAAKLADEHHVAGKENETLDQQPREEHERSEHADDDEDNWDAGHMQSEGDVQLLAPLMIRNIPGKDELFFDALNRKLAPISEGHDSLPTVMRRTSDDYHNGGPSDKKEEEPPAAEAVGGGDASHDSRNVSEDNATTETEPAVDADVPLKLRTTTNFGAPFGVA